MVCWLKIKMSKVIYKEFPIFGQASETAAKAALAAAMQGKYLQMHDALLKLDKRLDETTYNGYRKILRLKYDTT